MDTEHEHVPTQTLVRGPTEQPTGWHVDCRVDRSLIFVQRHFFKAAETWILFACAG